MRQIVADPDREISEYSLACPETVHLLPDPRQRLPRPRHRPVTDLVLAWAQQAPSATAVDQGDRTWSYAQLAEAAKAIAATLAEGGIVPGDVVAVTGRRSFGLIASLLGSLLAGGVILPLDPQLPGIRLRRMQSLASPRVCLCADDFGWNPGCSLGYDPLPGGRSERRAGIGPRTPWRISAGPCRRNTNPGLYLLHLGLDR